ncbi:MAG: hypothetical protein M1839_001392 [Geoglossum umbratile]|nr:MAG: hypothetical protein M1839_001392 [Geoglossum umbratile]
MHALQVVSLVALVLGAAAQTPPGFQPSTNTNLLVNFGNTQVQPPGIFLSQAATASEPAIAFSGAGKRKYVVIMMDIDVSFNGANTNLVHWIQGNFSVSGGSKLSSPQGPIAPYLGPSPPPGENHRYVEMLFNEPQGFSIPASFTAIFANLTASVVNRIGFDLNKFISDSKLGNPVAGNYFRVVTPNSTASATSPSVTATWTSAPNATAAGPSSSVVPSNDGIAGYLLSVSTLVGLGMVGIAINML